MPLTLEQAGLAGQLADAIGKADAAIADLDARIAEAAPLMRLSGEQASGALVRADIQLDAAETVGLYGYLKSVVEAKRDAAQAALDAIIIT